jgi:hypothetical protein
MSSLLARALFTLCWCASFASFGDPPVTAQGRCLWEDKAGKRAPIAGTRVGHREVLEGARLPLVPQGARQALDEPARVSLAASAHTRHA